MVCLTRHLFSEERLTGCSQCENGSPSHHKFVISLLNTRPGRNIKTSQYSSRLHPQNKILNQCFKYIWRNVILLLNVPDERGNKSAVVLVFHGGANVE